MSIQILAALGAVFAVVVLFIASGWRNGLLVPGMMLMASALAAPVDWQGDPVQTWLTPVQSRRSEIFALGALLYIIPVLFHMPRMKFGRISGPALSLMMVGMYGAFVRIIAGDAADGAQSLIFALVTIGIASFVLPSLFDSEDAALMMLRIIGLVLMLWIGASVVQFLIRPKVLTLGGGYTRFQGMLSNPQHAGAFLSVCMASTLFLMLNEKRLALRPIWTALTGVASLLLLWTGSRTGLGMGAIGAASILYTRLGSAILFLPVAAGIGIVAFQFFGGERGIEFQAFSGRGDTRSVAWMTLWQQFLDNPAFGTAASDETRYSENSFLLGLAAYGIGMGFFLLISVAVCGMFCLKLLRSKSYLHPLEKRLVDLCIGFVGMYFGGAVLEGYMLSRVSAPLVFMMIFSSMGVGLMAIARQRAAEAAWGTAPVYEEGGDDAMHDTSATYENEYGDYSYYGADPAGEGRNR